MYRRPKCPYSWEESNLIKVNSGVGIVSLRKHLLVNLRTKGLVGGIFGVLVSTTGAVNFANNSARLLRSL